MDSLRLRYKGWNRLRRLGFGGGNVSRRVRPFKALVFIFQTFCICIRLESRVLFHFFLFPLSFFFFLSIYLLFSFSYLSLSYFPFFFSYLSSSILTYVNTETREGHSRGGRRNRVCWARLFNIYISEAPKHLLPGHRKRFGRGKGRDWRLSANIYARSVLKILLGILMKSSRDAEGVGR